MSPTDTIALSLVSHTNAGKTTLARTLLGRDIGEVRDAPHVTEFADVHTLVETAQAERLSLWDTPGFGDSLRLARRLRQSDNPIGWFMSAVWDRWRDRPFWASQQAVRNVRDAADVVLYLVNAAEAPEAAGYVAPEMELLAWAGKPVIVLLNQLGAPRAAELEQADLARWRAHLRGHALVCAVLPLDAFARCWVQEFTLLRAVEAALQVARRGSMARLAAAWRAERLAVFDAAMRELAQSLARSAGASEEIGPGSGLRERIRDVGSAVGRGIGLGAGDATPAARAQRALAGQLDAETRTSTGRLIALHGLQGDAQDRIAAGLAAHFDVRRKLDEGRAAVWGGMLAGALTGLKADLLSGGLTLGGGLVAGGVLGALGAAGVARGFNLVRGTDRSWLAWNADALDAIAEAALLRYLAVAHFGRGRGDWAESDAPAHWRTVVADALAPERAALAALWVTRDPRADDAAALARRAAALEPLLRRAGLAALGALYPGALGGDNAPAHDVSGPLPRGSTAPAAGAPAAAALRPKQ